MNETVTVEVGGELVVDLDQLPTEALEQIKGALTIPNEARLKAAEIKQYGFWDMPETVALYRVETRRGGREVLCMPRGFSVNLAAGMSGMGIALEWDDRRTVSAAAPGYFTPFVLRDYQLRDMLKMIRAEQGFYKLPAGGGKGHPLGYPVPTPHGFRSWGDLEVGDEVLGSNGKPVKVTSIHDRGELETYRVVFSDRTEVVCDSEHLWRVSDRTRRKTSSEWQTHSVQELMKMGLECEEGWRWKIPIGMPADQHEPLDLPLDPYLVGALIANGSLTHAGTILTTPDHQVAEKVRVNLIGTKFSVHKIQDTDQSICDRYSISGITTITSQLGMRVRSAEKRIPYPYGIASTKARIELLRGLMDGDGSSRPNRRSVIYHTTSRGLADDMIELVQSLGGTACVRPKEREGKPIEYPVYINPPTWLDVWGTDRKRQDGGNNKRPPIRSIVSIEREGGTRPIRCITVDAEDHLYMIGRGYHVTHNTVTCLGMAAWLQQRTLVIVDRSNLAEQWRTRAAQFYRMPMDLDVSGNLHAAFEGDRSPGKIGEDVHEERDFTVALRQTLHSRGWSMDATKWWQSWGLVIFDEAHHLSAETTGDIARKTTARYLFGVSATPAASEVRKAVVYSLVGPIVAETSRQELYERGVLMRTTVEVRHGRLDVVFWPDHDAEWDTDKGRWTCQVPNCRIARKHSHRNNYSTVLKALVESDERNTDIAMRIVSEPNHVHLVPTRQKKHINLIRRALLDAGWPEDKIWLLRGEENAKGLSQQIADEVAASDRAVILSTVADEGLDIPPIDRVHVVFPMRGELGVIQTVGRGERVAEGKVDSVVIDYVEPGVSVFAGQYQERADTYRDQGYLFTESQGGVYAPPPPSPPPAERGTHERGSTVERQFQMDEGPRAGAFVRSVRDRHEQETA